jgi:hypothetical protein
MQTNQKNKTVCIVCPSKILGGTELVYFWIAKKLIDDGIKVVIIDYVDGWTKNPRVKMGDKITLLTPGYMSKIIINVDLFLCSAKFNNYTVRLGQVNGYDISGRIVSWLLHPRELTSNLYRVPRRILKSIHVDEFTVNRILDFLYKYSAISRFNRKLILDNKLNPMDEATARTLVLMHSMNESEILPVPIPHENTQTEILSCSRARPPEITRIIWISRMEGFKVPPLLELIRSIDCYSREEHTRRIELILIGDGEKLNCIKEAAKRLDSKVIVDFRGAVTQEALRKILNREYFDFAFGMGASLLECAAKGIPAIVGLAAESQDEYKSSKKIFRLLGARRLYSLGEYSDSKLPGVRYYEAIRFLKRSSLLARISYGQQNWYADRYKFALNKYTNHLKRELANNTSIEKCSTYKWFTSITIFRFYEYLFKNAKFPT